MPPAARLGDMHACPMVTVLVPHVGGPILPPCCPTVLIGMMPAARVSDMLTCVGPPDVIAMGSPTVLINNLMAARMGDPTAHGGIIVLGEPTVIIGEMGMGSPVTVQPSSAAPSSSVPNMAAGPLQPAPESSSSADAGSSDSSSSSANTSPQSPTPGSSPTSNQKKEKTWIGVEVRDFEGSPVRKQKIRIVLDQGQTLSGTTDAQGRARFEGVDPDSGHVHVPDIPEQDDYASTQQSSEASSSGITTYGPIRPVTQAPPREIVGPGSEQEGGDLPYDESPEE